MLDNACVLRVLLAFTEPIDARLLCLQSKCEGLQVGLKTSKRGLAADVRIRSKSGPNQQFLNRI